MSKYLFLKSFSSSLTLSICLLSQSAFGMEMERDKDTLISSKSSKKMTQNEKLTFKSDESDIHLPDTPWINLKPYLEDLIRLTLSDPMCEERIIHFKRLGKDSEEYFEWKDSLRKSFSYPISIGSGNGGAEGIKVDGKYEKYNSFLRISNYTKKEQEAREFPYKKFGGTFNESQVNLRTFYNIMARVGFTEDDFAKGKYGYQDQIYVKPVRLKNKVLGECAIEMKENILSTLERVTQPYVAFILELDKNVPYTLLELRSYKGRESFFHEIEPLAKIVEQEENRIYIVYYNDKRSTLDLHELALNEAKEKVANFIKEKYNNFEIECTIIPGRGNHVNSNGSSGVLNQMLPIWAGSPELKPYVKDINLCNGGGLYKINLIEPVHITLTSNEFEEDVEKVSYFISSQNEKGQNRLKIIHDNQPSEYIDKVFFEVMRRSSSTPSFPKSYSYGMTPSAHQLMWSQKDSFDHEEIESDSTIRILGPNLTRAKNQVQNKVEKRLNNGLIQNNNSPKNQNNVQLKKNNGQRKNNNQMNQKNRPNLKGNLMNQNNGQHKANNQKK